MFTSNSNEFLLELEFILHVCPGNPEFSLGTPPSVLGPLEEELELHHMDDQDAHFTMEFFEMCAALISQLAR